MNGLMKCYIYIIYENITLYDNCRKKALIIKVLYIFMLSALLF